MSAQLAGQTASLQEGEAGLRQESAQLDSEIQQLRQSLQMLPAVHVHHLTQLQDTWCQDKTCCSEVERKLAAASRQVTSMQLLRSVYKQMAEALGQHWEETHPPTIGRASSWRREPGRAGWQPLGRTESSRSSEKTASTTGRRCGSRATPGPSCGALVLRLPWPPPPGGQRWGLQEPGLQQGRRSTREGSGLQGHPQFSVEEQEPLIGNLLPQVLLMQSPWDAACTCTVDQRWTTVFCFDSRALAV